MQGELQITRQHVGGEQGDQVGSGGFRQIGLLPSQFDQQTGRDRGDQIDAFSLAGLG